MDSGNATPVSSGKAEADPAGDAKQSHPNTQGRHTKICPSRLNGATLIVRAGGQDGESLCQTVDADLQDLWRGRAESFVPIGSPSRVPCKAGRSQSRPTRLRPRRRRSCSNFCIFFCSSRISWSWGTRMKRWLHVLSVCSHRPTVVQAEGSDQTRALSLV